MILRTFLVLAFAASVFSATPALAAYNFQPGPSVPGYIGRVDGSQVRESTQPANRTADWIGFIWGPASTSSECSALAAAAGLSESASIWCVEQNIPTVNFNNCVFTCQGGQGGAMESGATVYTTPGSVKTFIYTTEPNIYTVALGDTSPADCGSDPKSSCTVWGTGTGYSAPPPTAYLIASPATIASGGTSTLSAFCSNADSASIDQGIGAITLTPVLGGTMHTMTVTPPSSLTYTLTCTGEGGSATSTATVTVGNGPDLVGQLMNVITSATVGETKTFFPGAMNIGNASTGAGFTTLLQIDDDSDHASAPVAKTVTSAILAPAGSSNGQTTYSFATAGTWYARACADANAAFAGTIAESNETNNCTLWSPITVVSDVPVGVPAVSCNANKTALSIGESVTFTATPSGGATSPYTWTASDGGSYGSGATVTRVYNTAGVYGMRVNATGATTAGFCPNITVTDPAVATCPGSPTADIAASPNRVRQGTGSTISWSAQNVLGSCTITGPGVAQTAVASACSVPTASVAVPTINAQSVYKITCSGASDSVIVNVLPLIEEF